MKVFLDANVFKNSSTELPRLIPRKQTLDWGHTKTEVTVHDLRYVNPLDRLGSKDTWVKEEARHLPRIAALATEGRISLIAHIEVSMEAAKRRNMDSATGKFYRAPIEYSKIGYENSSRTFFAPWASPDALRDQFLRGLREPRYLEIVRIVGAGKPASSVKTNSLMDAFYVWVAESEGCTHLLTFDKPLIAQILSAKSLRSGVRPVCPSQLLAEYELRKT